MSPAGVGRKPLSEENASCPLIAMSYPESVCSGIPQNSPRQGTPANSATPILNVDRALILAADNGIFVGRRGGFESAEHHINLLGITAGKVFRL